VFEPPGAAALDDRAIADLTAGRHDDPFAILGPHETPRGRVVRAFLPGALRVEALSRAGDFLGSLEQRTPEGLFSGVVGGREAYLLRIEWPQAIQIGEDPYAFGPLLGDEDLAAIADGAHPRVIDVLGAHEATVEGVRGVRFAVLAPHARRVALVGDFNGWDRRRHPMRLRAAAGVWELFIPRLSAGERYRFAIDGADATPLADRNDPAARLIGADDTPVVAPPLRHNWRDARWMEMRATRRDANAPLAIYAARPAFWKAEPMDGGNDRFAPDKLAAYVAALGFTHVELHLDGDPTVHGEDTHALPAPQSPLALAGGPSAPDRFAAFVDACHLADVGVLLAWTPAGFRNGVHGLAHFDGAALYESPDPRMARQPDGRNWRYDYANAQVCDLLTASALYWLQTFHLDGLRIHGLAAMLLRDHNRAPAQWSTNIYGGREDFEAVSLLQHINAQIAEHCPGAITLAADAAGWPGAARPVEDGGLGFSLRLHEAWATQSGRYLRRGFFDRGAHHDEIVCAIADTGCEPRLLPATGSLAPLIGELPGDDWRQRAGLRACLALAWTIPGKKRLFMGDEFGQRRDWRRDGELDWRLYDDPAHAGLALFMHALNRLYRQERSLHADALPGGFIWRVADDIANSVFAYERRAEGACPLLVVINMTPAPLHDYRIGISGGDRWREVLNSDDAVFGGSGVGNGAEIRAEAVPSHGCALSLSLVVPPLAGLVLRHDGPTARV